MTTHTTPATPRHLDVTEVAAAIRRALRQHFPGVRATDQCPCHDTEPTCPVTGAHIEDCADCHWHAACATCGTGAAWDVECVHEGRARSVSELRIVAASPCRCGAFGERAMREHMEWVCECREVEVFG